MKTKLILTVILVLGFTGCAGRTRLTPDKAIIGQWKSATTRYYIGPEKIVHHDIASGERVSYPYKVISVNDSQKTITLQDSSIPMRGYKILKLEDGNKTFYQVIEVAGIYDEPIKFNYVNAQQEP